MNESRLSEFWQNSLQHRSFVIGLILSFMMLFTGLLSLFWTPFPVDLLDIPHKLESASSGNSGKNRNIENTDCQHRI